MVLYSEVLNVWSCFWVPTACRLKLAERQPEQQHTRVLQNQLTRMDFITIQHLWLYTVKLSETPKESPSIYNNLQWDGSRESAFITYRGFCDSTCRRHGQGFQPQCEGLQPVASGPHCGCWFLQYRHSSWLPCNHPGPAPPSESVRGKKFTLRMSQEAELPSPEAVGSEISLPAEPAPW